VAHCHTIYLLLAGFLKLETSRLMLEAASLAMIVNLKYEFEKLLSSNPCKKFEIRF